MQSIAGVRFYSANSQPTENAISTSSKMIDVSASDWGRFFIDGQGRPSFVNRHDQILDTTPRLTVDNEMHGLLYEQNAEDIINTVEVVFSPRVVGDINEVLGTLSRGSATEIAAGATENFTLRFRDPANPALDIGAYSLEALDAYTDYSATDDEAGEGIDKTAQVSTNVVLQGGTEAQVEVTNNDANAIYLQLLQIRGRAVRTRREEIAKAEDAASIADYGPRRFTLSAPLISNRGQAQMLADYLLELYKDPIDRVEGIAIYANRNSTYLDAVRTLELLDPIRVSESQTGLSNFDGLVYRLQHRIRNLESHTLTVAIHAPYTVANPVLIDVTTFASGHALAY
jgi:hypothetical protein